MVLLSENQSLTEGVIKIAQFCAEKNLVPATSGNFSARIDSETILITQSGRDKASLKAEDLMKINYQGLALNPEEKPSAETLLHTQIYQNLENTNYIAHFHSSSSAVISKVLLKSGIDKLELNDYELLKALSGVKTHEHTEILPIFANDQNISRLAKKVAKPLEELTKTNQCHAYIISGHGLYTWGQDLEETIRHIDAINSLLESYILELQLSSGVH